MNKRKDLGIFPFREKKSYDKIPTIKISQSEQVPTFDSVFMALQSQNFSFSNKFYSFSTIFKRMLMSAIFSKIFFIHFMT